MRAATGKTRLPRRRSGLRAWAAATGALALALAVLAAAGQAQARPLAPRQTGPGLVLSKTATPMTFTGPGQHITYRYTLTNNTTRPVLLPVVADSVFGIIRCRALVLRPRAETTCGPRSLTTTSTDVADGQITNTAVARGLGGARSNTVTVTVRFAPVPARALVLTKTASPEVFTGPGQRITYTYTVTNHSTRTVLLPVVADSMFGLIGCRAVVLRPGAVTSCGPRTLTTTSTDVADGRITNTAVARGLGGVRSAPVTVTVRLAHVPAHGLEITKTAKPDTFTGPGELITYRYRVTNTGAVDLHDVTVTDSARPSVVICHLTILAPGHTLPCTATHTTTPADVKAGEITDTATATALTPDGQQVSATSEQVTVTRSAHPAGCAQVASTGHSYPTLQDAVNAAEPGDTVTVAGTCAGTTTIDKNLTITGHGGATLNGQQHGAVLVIIGVHVRLDTLTITGGSGSGIFNSRGTVTMNDSAVHGNHSFRGGGIDNNDGTVAMNDSTVTGNTADRDGGGIVNNDGTLAMNGHSTVSGNTAATEGGGITNRGHGTVAMTGGSAVSGNTAEDGVAGGIVNFGVLTVNDSTVSHNTTGFTAGGIYNETGSVAINDSTVTGNTAEGGDAGGIQNNFGEMTLQHSSVSHNTARFAGGGIVNHGPLTMNDSTVTGNTAETLFGGGFWNTSTLTLQGGSTVTANTAGTQGGGIYNSDTGTVTMQGHSTITGNHAKGGADSGGGIYNNGGTLNNAFAGPDGNVFDNTPDDIFPPVTTTCQVTDSGHGYPTLQGAVNAAEPDDTLTVAGTCTGTTTIDKNLTITGHGGATLNGEEQGHVLNISSGAHVTLDGLTITNGSQIYGGGVFNRGGTVTLNHSTVTGNRGSLVGGSGGGIWNSAAGTVTLNDSHVTGNTARTGGGIANDGTLVMRHTSTVTGNHAVGPAIFGGIGGGIWNVGTLDGVSETNVYLNTPDQIFTRP